jgi:hypothetical protein
MRTETRTVHIGEWLGPIDWTYDFAAHGWDRGGAMNPDLIPERVANLRAVEAGLARGERWTVYAYGSHRKVISVGMYDGWPYWKPTPFYLLESWLNGSGESMSWASPSGAYRDDRG